jgi:hypothetical protein
LATVVDNGGSAEIRITCANEQNDPRDPKHYTTRLLVRIESKTFKGGSLVAERPDDVTRVSEIDITEAILVAQKKLQTR